MSLTREDLHAGLHRFATKHDLDRFPSRQEFSTLQEETVRGFADMRRQLESLAADVATRLGVILEALATRMDSENK